MLTISTYVICYVRTMIYSIFISGRYISFSWDLKIEIQLHRNVGHTVYTYFKKKWIPAFTVKLGDKERFDNE